MEWRTGGTQSAQVRVERLSASDRLRFAGEIRPLRVAAGMTQEELAAAAGVDRKTIGNLERGAFAPQADVLRRVLRALGVSVDDDDMEPDTAQWLAVVAALVGRVPESRREQVMRQAIENIAREIAPRHSDDVGGAHHDATMDESRYAADLGNEPPDEDLRTP